MHFKQMFVTAICVLFLLKLKWPKSNNFYETKQAILFLQLTKLEKSPTPYLATQKASYTL